MSDTPSHGFTLGYDQETALGDGGSSYGEIRPDEAIDWSTATQQLIANSNQGHAHPADRSDHPIAIGATAEGSLNMRIRRSASANTNPPLAEFFESAGCVVRRTTAITVASYVDTGQWDLGDSGAAYGQVGDIILPKLEDATSDLDEYYYPSMVAAKATDTITPGMDLPGATANSEPIEVMTTIYPVSRPVVTGKTLGWARHTRADFSEDGSNDGYFLYKACALGSVGEFTVAYGQPIILPLNFLLGNVTRTAEELSAETYVDGEKFVVINNAFRFEHAVSNSSGGITRADVVLKEAKVNLGFSTVPIEGAGDGTVNGRSGYILTLGQPKITISATYKGEAAHPDYWAQLETPGTDNYIGLVQPTSALTTPAWALFMPVCYIDPETPPQLKYDKETVDAEVTLIASCAGYTSTSNDGLYDDEGYAPWYMGISGAAA